MRVLTMQMIRFKMIKDSLVNEGSVFMLIPWSESLLIHSWIWFLSCFGLNLGFNFKHCVSIHAVRMMQVFESYVSEVSFISSPNSSASSGLEGTWWTLAYVAAWGCGLHKNRVAKIMNVKSKSSNPPLKNQADDHLENVRSARIQMKRQTSKKKATNRDPSTRARNLLKSRSFAVWLRASRSLIVFVRCR